ncbi:hypothetical protein L6164_015197 [Bauhinia variegata]|uniref:Uncharacterized protein n=1 Tax=Bauhinia variegata TaxID=167791 RepID=A0ACB9NKK6_BAUVA|nr:hypothetical protein L6164_015197 [Bauhinia variegata]
MHGFRARVALQSIAGSLCKCKWHEHGGKMLTGESEICRTLTTTADSNAGADFLECGAGLTTRSMQTLIVRALRLGDRSRASNLLLDFAYGSPSLRADDFVGIFKYCAKSPDPLFVMEIWRLMEARDIRLNDKCSFLMMKALCKGGYLEEALSMIKFLGESRHLYPILPLYNSLLHACTEMQSISHASYCLDLMEKRMVGKNEITYTELLKLAVLQKNLPALHQIWEDYIKHYSMNIIALRKFIWSFTRLGDLTSAYKALQQMVSLAIRENVSIVRRTSGKLYSTRLDIPVPSRREIGLTILNLEEKKQSDLCTYSPMYYQDANSACVEQQTITNMGYKVQDAKSGRLNEQTHRLVMMVLRWSFSEVIHGCAQDKNYGLAEQLILEMQNLGLQPTSHTYDGFVRAVVSQRGFNYGVEVLKVMQQNNLKPYDSTLAVVSVSCSEALELDIAEDLLNQISECPYPYPCNALLSSCDKMNQPERAVRVFAKMKQMKLLPDIRTYELLFSLFGNVNPPYEEGNMQSQVDAAKRIDAIERDMARNGIQHSHLSMKNLLKALGEEGMIRELIQYLLVAENLFIFSNPSSRTDIYNVVLRSLVDAKESRMAIEIFKRMKSCGCQANAATYHIMIDFCRILRCFKSASLLISMMIRDGFYPKTPTYTALIKILLEDENFEETLNLLDQARSDCVDLDVILFNTVIREACDKGRIDVIELILECMHQEKIQPDSTTCSYVFSAYVNCGFDNTAIEALQVLSMRMIREYDEVFHWKDFVDEFILAEDLAAELKIIKLFEDSKENLAFAVLNLRWCAISGFPICWSADQSPWTKRLKLQ